MFRQLFSLAIVSLLAFAAYAQPKGFSSENMIVEKVSDHVFRHITYLQTQDFGKVPCNGMVVFDKGEAIIFDTPIDDATSATLIDWIADSLKCKVKAVIATHFHEDCVGGLGEFHKRGIPSFANEKTIVAAREHNFPTPQKGFEGKLEQTVGKRKVITTFFGEGHTRDNVIGYFPSEKAMFGGCLIKEVDATKGYLGDANEAAWSATVSSIKAKYPDVKTVIPGHGAMGGVALLDYTIKLFEKK